MSLALKLNTVLILSVASVSVGIAFYQTKSEARWLERELDRQALVLAESTAKTLASPLEKGAYQDLQKLADRLRDQQNVEGVGVYNSKGELIAVNQSFAPQLELDPLPKPVRESINTGAVHTAIQGLGSSTVHILALPIRFGQPVIGTLALFHGVAHIDSRLAALWRRALLGVAVQTGLIAAITLFMVRRGVLSPLRQMTAWLKELRTGSALGAAMAPEPGELEPLSREVSRLASSFAAARAAAEEEARLRQASESHWTAERLRAFIRSRMGEDRLFVVSNREPCEHFHARGGIEWSVPASGLVTALEPVLRACDGTWVAQASGEADRETVDSSDRVRVPPDHPQYTLRRVWKT